MQKANGFTIIELLTTITILAILFVITVPEYQRLRDKNTFRTQNQVVWDQIATARSSALTNKKCGDDSVAVAWQVVLDNVNNSAGFTHVINCVNGSDFGTDIHEEAAVATLTDAEVQILEINSVVLDLATTDVETLRINFLSGSAQTRIEQIRSDSTITRVDEIRVVVDHTVDESNMVQTICLERIAGFPTFNKTGIICEEDI